MTQSIDSQSSQVQVLLRGTLVCEQSGELRDHPGYGEEHKEAEAEAAAALAVGVQTRGT